MRKIPCENASANRCFTMGIGSGGDPGLVEPSFSPALIDIMIEASGHEVVGLCDFHFLQFPHLV
jgi:hypothetical protein